MTLFLTDTERQQLRADLLRAEHLALEHARILRGCQATLAKPPVDMLADPLAAFRLPSGAVAYETAYADEVTVGDWVQRCHGDTDWHHVDDVATYTAPSPSWFGQSTVWRVTYDGTAHDWAGTDAIRIARAPAQVVAAQERKAEASR